MKTELTVDDWYGHIINPSPPKLATDEMRWELVRAGDKFNPNITYRRRIDVGEGYELVGLADKPDQRVQYEYFVDGHWGRCNFDWWDRDCRSYITKHTPGILAIRRPKKTVAQIPAIPKELSCTCTCGFAPDRNCPIHGFNRITDQSNPRKESIQMQTEDKNFNDWHFRQFGFNEKPAGGYGRKDMVRAYEAGHHVGMEFAMKVCDAVQANALPTTVPLKEYRVLRDKYAKALNDLANTTMHRVWVKCSERLPDYSDNLESWQLYHLAEVRSGMGGLRLVWLRYTGNDWNCASSEKVMRWLDIPIPRPPPAVKQDDDEAIVTKLLDCFIGSGEATTDSVYGFTIGAKAALKLVREKDKK
jgi:hypothetical protein